MAEIVGPDAKMMFEEKMDEIDRQLKLSSSGPATEQGKPAKS
jgi:hypothetical protein